MGNKVQRKIEAKKKSWSKNNFMWFLSDYRVFFMLYFASSEKVIATKLSKNFYLFACVENIED